jgi:hypothetical protein
MKSDSWLMEGYALWPDSEPLFEKPEMPDIDGLLAGYHGPFKDHLTDACSCFWLFRYFHTREELCSVLLGDYYFSSFSRLIIPLDSIPVIDAFSDYLIKDTDGCAADFNDFVRSLPVLLEL